MFGGPAGFPPTLYLVAVSPNEAPLGGLFLFFQGRLSLSLQPLHASSSRMVLMLSWMSLTSKPGQKAGSPVKAHWKGNLTATPFQNLTTTASANSLLSDRTKRWFSAHSLVSQLLVVTLKTASSIYLLKGQELLWRSRTYLPSPRLLLTVLCSSLFRLNL